MKQAILHVSGPAAILERNDIDTDALFPAEFLKVTTRQGMGRHLFANWVRAGHPDTAFMTAGAGVRVLVAGRNFGCGSSREHAVWALADHGIGAVIALSYGDIFRNNCVKNDLVAATVTPQTHLRLLQALRRAGLHAPLQLDMRSQRVHLPDGETLPFDLAPGHAEQLMSDEDDIARTLRLETALCAHETLIARATPWLLHPD